MEESTLSADTGQLLILICGTDEIFKGKVPAW